MMASTGTAKIKPMTPASFSPMMTIDNEDRMQGNGFSHKGGHDDLRVDLIVDKVKNEDLERQGGPLQESDKNSDKGPHNRTNKGNELCQHGKKTKDQGILHAK